MLFEGLIRKAMQVVWRWQRALTLGARGIVLDKDGRVLLVRQTYTKGWLLPGGGVEFRETIELALARELEEEAGITLSAAPELLGVYANHAVFPGDHVAIYIVRHWKQTRTVAPNAEIAETGFFPLDALPEGVTPGTRRRLDEMRGCAEKQGVW